MGLEERRYFRSDGGPLKIKGGVIGHSFIDPKEELV